MKRERVSMRQICVLTQTGLLAPMVDLLPGMLSGSGGRSGWLAPLLALPLLLIWVKMLEKLFREEESGLFSVAARALGKHGGRCLTTLYIVWGIWILAAGSEGTARRLSGIWGDAGGRAAAFAVMLLAVWMVCGEKGALFRAGELFWLAMAVTALAGLLLGFSQVRASYLLPQREDWPGLAESVKEMMGIWGSSVFAAALLPGVFERRGAGKRAAGWMSISCMGASAFTAVVIGQMGAALAGRLPEPFLIVAQGLSVGGAISRLEAPAAALWLMADFCRSGLILAAIREAGGERRGKGLAAAAGGSAFTLGFLLPERGSGALSGILLGFLAPGVLWILTVRRERKEKESTFCAENHADDHRYGKAKKKFEKTPKK